MKVSGNAFGFTKVLFSEALTASEGANRIIEQCSLFWNTFHYLITIRVSGLEGIFKATTKITWN